MRPVVTSLVAIALALAPMSAMAAKPHSKTAHAKVVNADAEGNTDDKSEKADDKSEKDDSDKTDKPHHAKPKAHAKKDKASPIVPAKAAHVETHGSKKSAIKPVVHHAHNVDLGGPGHKEPKVGSGGAIIPASMVTKAPHDKPHAKPSKAADLPKLPNPHAGKPSKGGGGEKGARKASDKKAADTSGDDNAGEPERDEDFAELVARIRGQNQKVVSHEHDEHDRREETPHDEGGAKAKAPAPAPRPERVTACTKEPVEIVRGPEIEHIQLTKCDGTVAPLAIEQLSILIRPGGVARPTAPLAELAKKTGQELGFGIRRVDPRLVTRLQALVDHFSKGGVPAKIFVISGYRPASVGSMHSTGRAMDFRVEGVRNEEVVSFCKTLSDTGCGYYPNSSFVHVDVRDAGAGHVTWIDASGPGETPRYVRSWPPPPSEAKPVDRVSTQALEQEGVRILRAQRPLEPLSPFEADPADTGSVPDAADAH